MKIKCIRKDCSGLSVLRTLQVESRLPREVETSLRVGQIYSVYGMLFEHEAPWYYILEGNDDYPTPAPGDFFEVIDPTFESDWELLIRDGGDGALLSEIVPKEWAQGDRFYERLLDEEEREMAQFEIYRKRLGA